MEQKAGKRKSKTANNGAQSVDEWPGHETMLRRYLERPPGAAKCHPPPPKIGDIPFGAM